MFEKRSMTWPCHVRKLFAGVAGLSTILCLAMAPSPEVHAQPPRLAAVTTCAAPWSAAMAYGGGDTASENGTNYVANWWTQGDDPATHSGTSGSGQPWTAQGACGSDSGGDGGGSDGGSGQCAAAWSASAVYNGGDEASENGTNYVANWWTQGADPATHSGPNGSGQPWTAEDSCSGSSGGGGGGDDGGGDGGGGDGGTGGTHPPPADFIFSPYKDVTINLNWNTDVMSTKVTGTLIPVAGPGGLLATREPNLGAITLAFATGQCGSESWGGVPGQNFADANVATLDASGVDYIVSTGGAAGTFKCSDPAGMVAFISRYMSPHMVGVDFDIEGGQTQADINALVSQVVYAQNLYPNLRFSFTLATLAASDGSYGGVNSLGAMVVDAVKNAGIANYTINLMVMDFGSASPGVCVVSGGQCDMGQSAIQAAENLEHSFGIPASRIELTPMIGVNDVSSELFTVGDVDTVINYATSHGLSGVHFWSLDRDTPCSGGYASPTCNSVPSSTPLEYTDRFLGDLGQ
ncbi:MAG TPA: carbohydrate-binding protein [Oleiagrimonas sp.]|nr:carbohydrate-binding protein [Oleiagrimonas sp.]